MKYSDKYTFYYKNDALIPLKVALFRLSVAPKSKKIAFFLHFFP